ncbi:metal-dependent hydrolase, endonuclease/exonuclease/phosphatase family [Bacteroidales bacterium 6E]|nr:metal-dependent hydrolase, endonuclease/exonuclease/phosphatase family [Bacteroidales bacterium 6E]
MLFPSSVKLEGPERLIRDYKFLNSAYNLKHLKMKQFLLIILTLTFFQTSAQDMNIVSYNIRYNTPNDGVNAWPNRIEMVTGLLKFHDADIFGLQEALIGQIEDISTRMPSFKWFGTGRDDGKMGGEFSPIFYNSEKFELVDNGQFWLSETPDKPSKGWDAALNRICTWGKFKSKASGAQFFVFNTHFDHIGDTARANSAILIQDKISELSGNTKLPVILTGDFNLTPETLPIQLMKRKMLDSYEVSENPAYGPVGTFNAFKRDHPLNGRIDYVFVNDKVRVHKYGALTDSWDNRYPSDHLPLLVKISFK